MLASNMFSVQAHQRIIPRYDLRYNANWLPNSIRKLLMVGIDRLSIGLVCPSCVVTDGGDCFWQVGVQSF